MDKVHSKSKKSPLAHARVEILSFVMSNHLLNRELDLGFLKKPVRETVIITPSNVIIPPRTGIITTPFRDFGNYKGRGDK